MFRNTLTVNDKYPVQDFVNFSSSIQTILSIKPTNFLIFLFHFWNLNQILNILKKKMILIATLLRKLRNVKTVMRPLFKKHRSRTPFDGQHVKGSEIVVKSA